MTQVQRAGCNGRARGAGQRAGRGTLPRVWAVGRRVRCHGERPPAAVAEVPEPQPAVALYRRYTEALLRRYMRMSMAAGRVPSLMGREMFRGNVTHYRVHSFEDVVVFCHDVERRLGQMDALDRELVKRVALQRYTQEEAAGMLGISLRSVVRHYAAALDRLTVVFLRDRLLERQRWCQEG